MSEPSFKDGLLGQAVVREFLAELLVKTNDKIGEI